MLFRYFCRYIFDIFCFIFTRISMKIARVCILCISKGYTFNDKLMALEWFRSNNCERRWTDWINNYNCILSIVAIVMFKSCISLCFTISCAIDSHRQLKTECLSMPFIYCRRQHVRLLFVCNEKANECLYPHYCVVNGRVRWRKSTIATTNVLVGGN